MIAYWFTVWYSVYTLLDYYLFDTQFFYSLLYGLVFLLYNAKESKRTFKFRFFLILSSSSWQVVKLMYGSIIQFHTEFDKIFGFLFDLWIENLRIYQFKKYKEVVNDERVELYTVDLF